VRILLTGVTGQVGHELQRSLAPLGEIIAADRRALDLASRDSIASAVRTLRPALIVNAAAYTAVDRAESEPEAAMAANAAAPGVLAEEAKRLGAGLIHFSTDYVFDGEKPGAYLETDAPNPLNMYGRSKLEGERAVAASGARHLILRTSWVYSRRGKNFLLTMLELAKTRPELRIVDDQRGAPTSARAIADAVAKLAGRDWPAGTFHLTCQGATTWFGFARAIFERSPGPRPSLVAITTPEFPTPARRPKNSVLSNAKLAQAFGITLPDWQAALADTLG
jgi:dTDP-4-dehydrorhamnose reductase